MKYMGREFKLCADPLKFERRHECKTSMYCPHAASTRMAWAVDDVGCEQGDIELNFVAT